jgi:cellulose synthase/poly-beta-1,6-N-acetylglucosamine synthase-like glycosyltransferase
MAPKPDTAVLVSVVVPTCSRPDLLNRCLQAIMAQSFDPSQFEVIVIDDAGDESTYRLVEEWSRQAEAYAFLSGYELRLPQPVPLVEEELPEQTIQFKSSLVRVPGIPALHYLRTIRRSGPAAARNLGWRAAIGEIIAFTDDDCIPAQDWLKNGVLAFTPEVQGVSGAIVVPLPPKPTDYELNSAGLARSEFVTANCFYRRSALEAVEGFDENFKMAWREDSDLYFRILKLGRPLAAAPAAVVTHPVRPARWGVSLSQQRKSMFNALLYRKHPQLYRQKFQAWPPWPYYGIVAALFMILLAFLLSNSLLGSLGLAAWTALTLRFCLLRLKGTSHSFNDVLEMLLTSILIPPLCVFWRLRGAIRFHVFFL